MKFQLTLSICLVFLVTAILQPATLSTASAQSETTDAVAACATGVDLAFQGRFSDARPYLEQGFQERQAAQFPDRDDEGLCVLFLGMARQSAGELDSALEAFLVAQQVFSETKNEFLEMGTRNNIATVLTEKRQYGEALVAFQEVLVFLQKQDHPTEEFIVLLNIGSSLEELSRLPEAERAYYDALNVADRAEDDELRLQAHFAIGQVSEQQAKIREALIAYRESLAIARQQGDLSSQGKSLAAIGMLQYNQGSFQDAMNVFHEMLAVYVEIKDERSQASALHNIGVVYRAQASYGNAIDALNQALTIRRSLEDRRAEAMTLVERGQIYFSLGDYAAAKEDFNRARELNRTVDDLTIEMQVLNNTAIILANEGNTELALTYLERVKQHEAELDYHQRAALWSNFGVTYLRQSRYVAADEAFGEALQISRYADNPQLEAITLNNVGAALIAQGQVLTAIETLQRGLALLQGQGSRSQEVKALTNLGHANSILGDYGRSIEYYNRALSIADSTGEVATRAQVLRLVGETYARQGRIDDAERTLIEAQLLAEDVGDVFTQASALVLLGHVYRVKNLLPESIVALESARSKMLEIGDKNGLAQALSGLGEVYDDQARYVEAMQAFEDAYDLAREIDALSVQLRAKNGIAVVLTHQARFSDAIKILEETLEMESVIRNVPQRAVIHFNLGVAYQGLGIPEAAVVQYEEAINLLETLRIQAGNDISRAKYIAQFLPVYQLAAELLVERHRLADAFFVSEQARARSFLDSLSTGYVQLSDAVTNDLIQREQQAYFTREEVERALALERQSRPMNEASIEMLEQELRHAEETYSAVLAELNARDAELTRLITERSDVLSKTEVQALLDEDTTLVSFFLLDGQGALAFVITQHDFNVVKLPAIDRKKIADAVNDMNDWRNMDNIAPLPLRNLYDWLIAPVVGHITTQKVAIVPHLWLHYVPFSALTDGNQYFGEKFLIFQLPSASSLPMIANNASMPSNSGLLVIASPDSSDVGLPKLVYAQAEGEAIAAMLNAPLYLGTEASEDRFRVDAQNARIVHIAAHARFNSANPLYSSVYLAPGETADGLLEVHEIYSLDLSGNELVVLSACETNLGQISSGDELVGMTRAFMFAGSPSILASLWPVDDAATEALMTSFYQNLIDGMNKVQALQAAQDEVRDNPMWSSPYYWAGFVLNGDPGTAVTSTTLIGQSSTEIGVAPENPVPDYPVLTWPLVVAGISLGMALMRWLESKRNKIETD